MPPHTARAESTAATISAGLPIFTPLSSSAAISNRKIAEGSWYVVPGEPGDAFRCETDDLWREVLHHQNSHLAILGDMPDDYFLN